MFQRGRKSTSSPNAPYNTSYMYAVTLLCGFAGVGAYLKSKNPDIKVVLADPQVHMSLKNNCFGQMVFCCLCFVSLPCLSKPLIDDVRTNPGPF